MIECACAVACATPWAVACDLFDRDMLDCRQVKFVAGETCAKWGAGAGDSDHVAYVFLHTRILYGYYL